MCLTLVPFAVCSLPTYNIHANLQQLSARVRVATAVNRFHTLRGAGCGRGGLRYGSEDYWLVHGVSIQGIEKMVGGGGRPPCGRAHGGGPPSPWGLRPREGCALPEGATMGLRPRRHRGFGVVTYVRVPDFFTSHSYVHVHTTLSGMCTQHCQPRETRPIAVRLYVCVSYRR